MRVFRVIAACLVLVASVLVAVGAAAPISDAADGDISTVAGAPTRQIRPRALAVDDNGDIYTANVGVVQRVDALNGEVTVIAGLGFPGFTGDGGPALDAQVGYPNAIAFGPDGSIFIGGDSRVRRIDTSGIITTIAGTGLTGSSGDGGPATEARLNGLASLAFDTDGNLYISDSGAHRVRMVDTSGIITTVAGTGTGAFSGDGGPATEAQLRRPGQLTFGPSGNLFIADNRNNRIRKIDTAGIITTVAGNGLLGYDGDGGPALDARLTRPTGLAVDAAGSLFISDGNFDRVRRVDPEGVITTIAGTEFEGFRGDGGPATEARLNNPQALALDTDGNLAIADYSNERIRWVDTDGTITTVAGDPLGLPGDGGPAIQAEIYLPAGSAFDAAGNFYFADEGHHRVRKISPGGIITTFAGTGIAGLSGDGGPATSARLRSPRDVAVDSIGNVYIADLQNSLIRKVEPNGRITTFAGGGNGLDGGPALGARLREPTSIAFGPDDHLYVASAAFRASRIRKVDSNGIISTVAGTTDGYSGDGGPATQAQLYRPFGLDVDRAGNIYVSDFQNHRVRKIDTDGIIRTIAGTGIAGFSGDGGLAINAQIELPLGVTVDGVGNVFFADRTNDRVRMISPDGIIRTIAGNGLTDFAGDGGTATQASLDQPTGVTIDSLGNLYISDQSHRRVRVVEGAAVVVGEAPTLTDDSRALVAPAAATIDVLANDNGPGGFISVSASNGAQGTTTVNPDLTITYTPGASTATTDTFTYTACTSGGCDTASATITVTPPECAGVTATLWGTDQRDSLRGTLGDDVIVTFDSGGSQDRVVALAGNDLVCSNERVFVTGGPGDDRIFGGSEDDRLLGGDGNDVIRGNGGDDEIDGGAGDDQVFGGAGADTMTGFSGNDVLNGGSGDDNLSGGDGNDKLIGGANNDTLTGGAGNDRLEGRLGSDLLTGGAGNDRLLGGDGDDTLNAGPGDDRLLGNSSDDVLRGGPGDDQLDGGSGGDICNGGTEIDTASRCEDVSNVP